MFFTGYLLPGYKTTFKCKPHIQGVPFSLMGIFDNLLFHSNRNFGKYVVNGLKTRPHYSILEIGGTVAHRAGFCFVSSVLFGSVMALSTYPTLTGVWDGDS